MKSSWQKEMCWRISFDLSSDTQVDDLQCEDSKDMEKGIGDSLVDSLQLKISMIDERVRAISEEMQALKLRMAILKVLKGKWQRRYIDRLCPLLDNMAEARAIIRMLVLENIRLQGYDDRSEETTAGATGVATREQRA